ncbi:MAG: prepilin-type N-terminal cleavage/methylation domain-containing protein [Planctomycetota bacterium]
MRKIKPIRRTGLTLIELMVALALATICILAVGAVFSDSQKAWNKTYTKANNAIMLDSHLAGKAFETTIRNASCEKYLLDPESRWVEVYYFASETSATLDRYARLYVEGGIFYIQHGIPDPPGPRQTLYTNPICENVTAFSFSGSGRCIRMQMTVSDNDSDVSFISSAIPQNE